ncbi:hypothetical protein [Curtobacterium sp. MCJR17_043]|uniref:hypothetical protein n=1 Tax=Curtobacterium sp. MCJR17_043 TaxID=2175660 RepID=UPI0024DFB8E2|nr:hypothetical protein [Curtobacterium sp. MCJR17_043]WIB34941.1 hypothetical protein DEJ15_10405 [Curtobacterium sp. MCJR17_043]
MVESGAAFPDRDLIVFVTAGVVVVTIVGQSLVLPAVVRWAAFDGSNEVVEERRSAERVAIEAALDALPKLARRVGADAEIVDRIREDYEGHLALVKAEESDDDDHPLLQQRGTAVELELALVRLKAATVLRLRDEGGDRRPRAPTGPCRVRRRGDPAAPPGPARLTGSTSATDRPRGLSGDCAVARIR